MAYRPVLAGLVLVLGAAGACAKPAPEPPSGDALVLEVGGQQSSLRESLRSMGKEVAPPRRLRPAAPAPQVEPARQARPAAPPSEDAADVDPPAQAPPQPNPAESEWVVVELLEEDRNLGDVAKRHLGSSRRYLDIQRWNGIDDAQARRLRAGYKLKLKRSELR
ncbi:MAG: hypothetical protein VYA51_05860 [Planctomycetota bacterium]|nr:hypothetical protein [Planctomycetota bacterium]